MIMSHRQTQRAADRPRESSGQIWFALRVVLLSAALFAGMGYVAMREVDSATKVGANQIEVTGFSQLDDPAELKRALLQRERAIDRGIIGGAVVLSLGLLAFVLVSARRVYGPLARVAFTLKKIGEGSFAQAHDVNEDELLAELSRHFAAACIALRETEQREVAVWRGAVEAVENDPRMRDDQAFARLRAQLRIKEDGLG